jgi:hypothetical protein
VYACLDSLSVVTVLLYEDYVWVSLGNAMKAKQSKGSWGAYRVAVCGVEQFMLNLKVVVRLLRMLCYVLGPRRHSSRFRDWFVNSGVPDDADVIELAAYEYVNLNLK